MPKTVVLGKLKLYPITFFSQMQDAIMTIKLLLEELQHWLKEENHLRTSPWIIKP